MGTAEQLLAPLTPWQPPAWGQGQSHPGRTRFSALQTRRVCRTISDAETRSTSVQSSERDPSPNFHLLGWLNLPTKMIYGTSSCILWISLSSFFFETDVYFHTKVDGFVLVPNTSSFQWTHRDLTKGNTPGNRRLVKNCPAVSITSGNTFLCIGHPHRRGYSGKAWWP